MEVQQVIDYLRLIYRRNDAVKNLGGLQDMIAVVCEINKVDKLIGFETKYNKKLSNAGKRR